MTTPKSGKPSPSKKAQPAKGDVADKEKADKEKAKAEKEKAKAEKEKAKNDAKASVRTAESKARTEKPVIAAKTAKSAAPKLEKEAAAVRAPKSEKNEKPEKAERLEKAEKSEKPGKEKEVVKIVKTETQTKPARVEKSPPPPAAEPPKSKLTKEDLQLFKAQLLELRDRLMKQIGAMEGEALKEAGSEVSVDHMADHGTETFDQDFTLGLIENEENTIREIDEALHRMTEGTYGMCEPCIEEMEKLCKTCPHIPKARLEAIPYTRFCVEYARVAERNREIEEAQDEEEE